MDIGQTIQKNTDVGCMAMTLQPKSNHSKCPEQPRPKKARQVRSYVKVLLTVFFDCKGMVNNKFLPQGCTVNKKYYLVVRRRLCEAICVRLIRKTTLKLGADCTKQFARNAQNCGKTNHRFSTMITHQFIHLCLGVNF